MLGSVLTFFILLFYFIFFSVDFLSTKLKALSMKEEIDELDFINIQKLLLYKRQCQVNETTNQKLRGNICKSYLW